MALLGALLSLAGSVACGPVSATNYVTNVVLSTHDTDGDAWAEANFTINAGNLSFPSVDLPIPDPQLPGTDYGQLGISPTISGGTQIDVQVNLTAVAKLQGTGAELPNGAQLPIGGLDPTKTLSIPISNTGATLYVSLETGANPVFVIGTALAFSQFDSLGSTIGSADLFLSFALPDGVRGIAGIFTGSQAGQSGFGVFVDASSLLAQLENGTPPASGTSAPSPVAADQPRSLSMATTRAGSASAAAPATSTPNAKVTFSDVHPSSHQESSIESHLMTLSARHTRLGLQ
jgi:hypothetical protein